MILRASGFKALHDEDAIFARQRDGAEQAARTDRRLMGDAYAFTLAFKGVVLEGLEVAFIVLTCGANQHSVPLAAVGAVAAIVPVVVVGPVVRAPLARVPENTLNSGSVCCSRRSGRSGRSKVRARPGRVRTWRCCRSLPLC